MSRLGGASAVAQLVADIPLQSVEGDNGEVRSNQQVWEKWSNEETSANLMEEDCYILSTRGCWLLGQA
ncbi:hypothetical protein Leryth_014004 [Lithospermum erythrorhizon]|nr:hypothetical protein Leryth_014004 [Lithospermum erythrorhizon]